MADDDKNVINVSEVSKVSKDGGNEVVEGEAVDDLNPAEDEAKLVLTLEGTIKNHISQIDKLRIELSDQKAMLADTFEGDLTYKEHAEAAKVANKVKSATKAEILKRPSVAVIAEKVKSLSSQMKELSAALSDYLGEFNRLSGMTEIEGEDGELREIVYVAKLVKKPR